MADISGNLAAWSSTSSSNAPSGATNVGTGLDDNLREIQGVVVRGLSFKGADIPSAATTDLGAVEGLEHDITGITTITSFGTGRQGLLKILQFDGALTLTNSGNLVLPGAANIVTVAGDVMVVSSEGGGVWRCANYLRSSQAPNGFASGTRLSFQQTNAPTGWTKDLSATYNDSAPRFTTGAVGTGGAAVFSTAFVAGAITGATAPGTSDATAAGTSDATAPGASDSTAPGLQAHTHTGTTGLVSADHSHTWSGTSSGASADHVHQEYGWISQVLTALQNLNASGGSGNNANSLLGDVVDTGPPPGTSLNTGGTSADHTHTVSGTTSGISANHSHGFTSDSTGAGSGHTHTHSATHVHTHTATHTHAHSATHTHTMASANLKFADMIVASKD